jgi:DNA-binding CsgD family transcriptional regulator
MAPREGNSRAVAQYGRNGDPSLPTVVGRDGERGRVEQFLDAPPVDSPCLVIVGEAGIGKSTLWSYGVGRARAAGHRVLRSRPTQDEFREPAAGLADLFDRIDAEPDTPLATHVTAITSADTRPAERGRHTMHALRILSESGPVLIAVDDLHWLDTVSAKAIRFALTRLTDERVRLLATARLATSGDDSRLVIATDAQLLEVGPMPVQVLRRVLAGQVSAITAPELMRAHELSNGNPMLAVELVRFWQRGGRGTIDLEPFHALADRMAELSTDATTVARVLALCGPARLGVIERASDVAEFAAAVRAGVEAGILQIEDDFTLRYTHALYASAVVASMTVLDRAAIHARLAVVVPDPDVRARHLAHGTPDPDEAIAAQVDAAASGLARRGAYDLAAHLAGESVRLTPGERCDALADRALREAVFRAASGDAARALASAEHLVATLRQGPQRAEALALRVFLHSADGERFLHEALEYAGSDEVLRAQALDLLGWQVGFYCGRLDEGIAYSTSALDISTRLGATDVTMCAEATLSICWALKGRPREDLMDHAIALDTEKSAAPLGRWPPVFRARQLLWAGYLDEARFVFEQMRRRAVTLGSEFQRPYRLYELALVDIAAGDLEGARRCGEDALESARDAGNEQATAWVAYALGLIAAYQGDDDGAHWAAVLITDWQAATNETPRRTMADEVLGTLAASQGDWADALRHFERALQVLDAMGFAHPGARPALPRAIEAATMLGDVARCTALTERLAAQAMTLDAPWVDAQVDYARGQLAALNSANEEATELLADAAESLGRTGYRLDAARVHLTLARVWLRAGQRSRARNCAERARAEFARAPAPPWALAAEDVAQRCGSQPTGAELTAAEVEIAALIAAGRTNREIAAQLFVAVSTVEAHLTRIYRKLDLRGRTALTRWVHATM